MPLTDAKIRGLKPKEKPYKVADYDGLYVNVSKTGSRLWRFKYRVDGKEGLLSFGKYPDISLQEARSLRDEARKLVAKGINPAAEKRERKAKRLAETEHTFENVAKSYLSKQVNEGRSEATIRKKEWLLGIANESIGKLPIKEISAQTVLAALKEREALGQYETVRRLRSTISAVFRYAVASGLADGDPTYALRDALIRPTVKHLAAITDEETLRRYIQALDGYGGKAETRIALWLLMLFACRPGELRLARWDEFDIENRVWTIPASRMKMRREHKVPLSDAALCLLQELRTLTGWAELLFPSLTSSLKPMSENTMNQALRRLGFEPDEVTSHGFRSTFSTFANESGLWSYSVIEAALSHQDQNAVRRVYNRSEYWADRVALVEWWASYLVGLKRGE